MGRIKKNYNKSKITKLKELISELESELIQILNRMGQTKGGDVSLDGNLDLNVSVDGGGTVALIVVSVLAAVVVILLIVFFSCKRGCKCCDNLCCKGRCHTTEAEKAVIEQNKKLQDDLRKMNHNLQTLQLQMAGQNNYNKMAYNGAQPGPIMNQPLSANQIQHQVNAQRHRKPNLLSIENNPSTAASLPSHSPKLGHKSYHSNQQRNHRCQKMSAINQQRHHQTNARYPDRVDSPIVSSNPTQSTPTGYDPRYIDV